MTEHPKTLTVVEARTNLSELLGEVFYTGQPIVIERHGKPMAVVINPDTFARFQLWQAQHGEHAGSAGMNECLPI